MTTAENKLERYRVPEGFVPSDAEAVTISLVPKSFGSTEPLKREVKVIRGANALLVDEQPAGNSVGVYSQILDGNGNFQRGLGVSYVSKVLLRTLRCYLETHGFRQINPQGPQG